MAGTNSSKFFTDPQSPLRTMALVCFVASLAFLAAKLGGMLVLRPQMLWPLWPGCAILVAVLLIQPRKLWPLLIVAGLTGFVLYDLTTGFLSRRSIVLLVLSDLVEILIAALGLSYSFEGLPRLNSVKSLARYSLFAVLLAPASAAFIGASAIGTSYWLRWRVSFLTEALALLTLTPVLLSLVAFAQTLSRRPRTFYLEACALILGLALCAYITFDSPRNSGSPVLLYTILPFLLWAALRFRTLGVTSSMILVAFLSIWGAIHGRGPFTGSQPLNNMWSLQLLLFFAATPFLVLAVVVEEHRQDADALREGEQRFRLVANTAPVMIWMSGFDKLCNYFNQPWLDFTGRPLEAELGAGWVSAVHPDDRRECLETYTRSFDRRESFKMQYRLRRYDGEYRWVLDFGVPRLNPNGSLAGYIGSCIDITDRKLAEETLADMGRRLTEAHEEERTWIARELHDDINQRIALASVELEQLRQNLPKSAVQAHHHVSGVLERLSDLGNDIQALSHRLHSSKLEYLGIVAAAQSFCRELSEQQKVEIEFNHAEVPKDIPEEISLCLFRVLQEALQNAVRYSHVRHFQVELLGTSEDVHLRVSDSGVGFDPAAATSGRGLGLISMQERVRWVNGEFSVESRAQHGTTVHARVPLSRRLRAQAARSAG